MTATPRAPEPRPDGSVPVLSPLGVVLGYAIPGRHLPAEANARRWAASGDLLKALRLHIAGSGHTAGCPNVTAPRHYGCSERCRLTHAAIDAASPAAEVPADE